MNSHDPRIADYEDAQKFEQVEKNRLREETHRKIWGAFFDELRCNSGGGTK